MKKYMKILIAAALMMCMVFTLAGCGSNEETNESAKKDTVDTSALAGDYYMDLTDLGMNLTVFLRLDNSGNFTLSNTLSFETAKSAGTYQPSEDGYFMVFTSVNGEAKSISDGITSGFKVCEDGSLDFSGYGTVAYGSASISTTSAEDPGLKLVALPVTEDYAAPSTDSSFQQGVYTAEAITEAGVTYGHTISFYEDNTYLHVINYTADGKLGFAYETGTYGVSTTTLALDPAKTDETQEAVRVQCEIVDGTNLTVSVLPYPGAAERVTMSAVKTDAPAQLASLVGTGAITGSPVTFEVTLALYEDGSYVAVADGYEEKGLITIDTAAAYAKQYPDHPSTGVRGMAQVSTVPSAACEHGADGKLTVTDLRVCTSANLTRFKATVTE